jgi:hypothetical protein
MVNDMTIEELEAKLDAKGPERQALWNTFARDVLMYSTPLFAVTKTPNGDMLTLAGSGTFLANGTAHYILTAAHVWHEILKHANYIGIMLREIHDHKCLLEVTSINAYEPEHPRAWNEWGPDIILLRIPAIRVGEIKAFKVFYEMEAGRRSLVTRNGNETYLLVGTPSALGSYTRTHASVQVLGMWVGLPGSFMNGEWDYFDVKAKLFPHSDANTFGGVSGGGLWRVQIYCVPDSDQIDSTIALEGLPFYELGTTKGEGTIRCHGLKSIMKALTALPVN